MLIMFNNVYFIQRLSHTAGCFTAHTEDREAGLSPTRCRLAHASGSLALLMRTADLTWDALMNCFIQLSQTLQLTSNQVKEA